eukprot:2270973-Pyramimonas_sp.AAC.1
MGCAATLREGVTLLSHLGCAATLREGVTLQILTFAPTHSDLPPKTGKLENRRWDRNRGPISECQSKLHDTESNSHPARR